MPSHNHSIAWNATKNALAGYGLSQTAAFMDRVIVTITNEIYGATKIAGGEQPHNNMPPYRVVYIWKRTG